MTAPSTPMFMSLRTVLVAGMLAVALIPAALIGAIGVYSINKSVRSEAQSRVNQDLEIVGTAYREQLARLAYSLEISSSRIGSAAENSAEIISSIRRELDLTVLNLCDAEGRPIAGSHSATVQRIPLGRDPVMRKALEGKSAWGTVLLDPERLQMEGGAAFQEAAQIYDGDKGGEPISRAGLMWWIACPIVESSGQVKALLYGGRLLNFNYELVDKLRGTVFSEMEFKGKPRGTVTIFKNEVRVATNVLTQDGARAIGTKVSETVRRTVLEQGMNYTGEALVVDAWYLSAYKPLRDPAGKTIGMVYVGLLRAPYDDMQDNLIAWFLIPVGVVGLLAVYGALYIVNRITRPVRALSQSASRLATGDLESVNCPSELPVVADPALLRIALNNFLTNAAKYGREGGKATVNVKREGDLVTLTVWNEGEGFPPEEAGHLFEKFFRIRNSTTHAKRGSGIGLFTVKNIAELHGGRAWAESEPGAWAAFHLSFPAAPPATA